MRPRRLLTVFALLAIFLLGVTGCMSMGAHLVMPFYFKEAPLPASQVRRDIPYRLDAMADDEKNRLDLFLPSPKTARPWPVLVFVHGGGWRHGDRTLRMGGAEVYANIGRFLAGHGVGSAVISYRLQPAVGWHAQVDDVASAVAWLATHVAALGGDPKRIFLSGHSAGAQLVARVTLDPEPLEALRLPPGSICGLISVSGAGFDLEDTRTYELGASKSYYERRFRNAESEPDWAHEASTLAHMGEFLPATLILYADGDWPALRHQSQLLGQALQARGARVETRVVEGKDHYTIVPTLSRDDRPAGEAILDFVARTRCEN
ncbi:MAG: alpha/beta hydrolase [Myxococcota bacterium]